MPVNSFDPTFSMLIAMLIIVQIENEQVHFHIFQCIYFESFQIHSLPTIYHFKQTNRDIHVSFLFQSLPKLFSHACNLHQ